ncbi:MAG: TonB-dependent receptor [Caulobacteraceae bacterium]|nr:TonB-dependent receptor [Caulobacteraceae bacterium]
MNRKALCGGTALAALFSLAAFATPALAQTRPPADVAEVEEVVVTGSFIAGTPEDAALPVDVIGAQELVRQGSPTTVNLVKNIPSAQSSIGESNRFLGTAAGTATINLRGFGSTRTLVLMNGRRMADSPTAIAGGAVDINFIPNAAIGRIEILRDGAAATYGSDAVGGVVNFITRKDLDGLEISGNYAYIDESGGDYDINAAYGWVGDRGNILLAATYRRRSELQTTERDWALRPFAENFFGGWSTASNPGVFTTGTAAQLAAGTFSQSFLDNGCTEMGGTRVSAASAAAGCRFQFTQYDNLVNDEYHYQLYGEVNFDLTDDLKFHGEALWARHDVPRERVSPAQSTTQFPSPIMASGGSPGGGTSPYPAVGLNQQSRFYIPPNNPGLAAFLAASCPALGASICANAAANGVITSQTQWRPQGFGGNPLFPDEEGADIQSRKAEGLRIAAGLKGRMWNDIGWDFGLTYMRNYGHTQTPDISVTRMQLAMRGLGGPGCDPATGTPGAGPCHWYNPFSNGNPGNAALGLSNPFFVASAANDDLELYEWMRGGDSLIGETYSELAVADLVFNGELPIQLGGGAIGWAAGGQFRWDRTQFNRNAEADIAATPCIDDAPFGDGLPLCAGGTGPWTFYGATEEYDIDREVYAAFAEVRLPILENLEVTGAIRYEYYGGAFGSTTNPKIAARWQVTDWLALRGSAGTTFRAPPQTILTPGSSRGLAQFNLPGVGALYRPVDTANNPNLEPETANTYNAGLLIEAGGFRASVDYFRFDFKDELTTETAASLVSTMFPSADDSTWRCDVAEFRSRFTFAVDADPVADDCLPANLLGVRTNWINGPDVKTSGIDFSVSNAWDQLVWDTDLQLGLEGTYTFEYKRGALVTLDGFTIAQPLDRAGLSELLSAFYSYPKLRASAWANFHRGPHNLRWTTRFKEGTINVITGFAPLGTRDEITHDIVYSGELPWDTTLTLSVFNIFDKDPPFTRSQYNYDYTNASFLGRVFQVGVKKRF